MIFHLHLHSLFSFKNIHFISLVFKFKSRFNWSLCMADQFWIAVVPIPMVPVHFSSLPHWGRVWNCAQRGVCIRRYVGRVRQWSCVISNWCMHWTQYYTRRDWSRVCQWDARVRNWSGGNWRGDRICSRAWQQQTWFGSSNRQDRGENKLFGGINENIY